MTGVEYEALHIRNVLSAQQGEGAMTQEEAVRLAGEIAYEAGRLLNDVYQWGHRRKEAADRLHALAQQVAVHALAERSTCDWQPIATAPKDGTPILACHGPSYNNRGLWPAPVVCVYWGTYHPNAKGGEAWRDGSGHKRPYLTHWQPLPAPPTPSATCSICRRDDCAQDHACE